MKTNIVSPMVAGVLVAGLMVIGMNTALRAATLNVQNGLTVAGDPYIGTETAWIHSGVPNNVVGTNSLIRVGFADDSPDQVYRTVVRFGQLSHFSGVTPAELGFASTDIVGARVKLYKRDGEGSGAAQLHILDSVDQNWTESFTTWNNRRTDIGSPAPTPWSQGPGIGGAYSSIVGSSQAFSSANPTGTEMTFELTGNAAAMQIVKDWVSGANTSGTFFLRATTEGGTGNNYYSWYSEQDAGNNALKPMLQIDYEVIPEPALMGVFCVSAVLMLRRQRQR